MRHKGFALASYLIIFIALIDQLSKKWILDTLHFPGYVLLINEYLNFTLTLNRGITFGLLNSIDQSYITVLLIVLTTAVVLLLGRWLWVTTSLLVSVALGFIIGGAIGNVIDRFQYGAVIDFIDAHYLSHHWYAFNCADSAIVTGVSILLLESLVRGQKKD